MFIESLAYDSFKAVHYDIWSKFSHLGEQVMQTSLESFRGSKTKSDASQALLGETLDMSKKDALAEARRLSGKGTSGSDLIPNVEKPSDKADSSWQERERKLSQDGFQAMMEQDYKKAAKVFKELLEIQKSQYGPESKPVANTLLDLGVALTRDKRPQEGEPILEKSVSLMEKLYGSEHQHVGVALRELGRNYLDQGKFGKAEEVLDRSVKIMESQLGENHPITAFHLTDAAKAKGKLGKFDEAEQGFKRALNILENDTEHFGPNSRTVANVLEAYAEMLLATGTSGNAKRAEEMMGRVRTIRDGQVKRSGTA